MLGSHWRTTALLFTDDPFLSGEIRAGLKHYQTIDSLLIQNWNDFDRAVSEQEISLFLFVLPENPADGKGTDRFFFERVIKKIPRLRRRYPCAQILLITVCKLSIQQTCQAAVQGVAGIVNSRSAEFPETLREHLEQCCQHYRNLKQSQIPDIHKDHIRDFNLIGTSKALIDVVTMARKAARVSDAPVIITGESGTGKQRLAEMVHRFDAKRSRHPFICVNCAAITGSLAESELFGHAKGAFTGATDDRLGYFRSADGGTIMLDEIAELDPALQPKILRVAQEGKVLPVGSDREYEVDVRIMAATHRNLEKMVQNGAFRLDLYQRLNVIQLNVPPLRQRIEDIPALFENFLRKYAHYSACQIKDVDPVIYEILAKSIGPGNVRELENLVRQILVFKERGTRIEITDLPREVIQRSMDTSNKQMEVMVSDGTIEALASGSKSLTEVVEEYEKFMLARLIERGYSQTDMAENLGITRRTLYNKLHKYDLR